MADEEPATPDSVDPRDRELAAAQARITELEQKLAPPAGPKPLSAYTDMELTTSLFDAIIVLLGSHPSVDIIWAELRGRMTAPAAEPKA
jgi:hypothetical protein